MFNLAKLIQMQRTTTLLGKERELYLQIMGIPRHN